MTGIDENAVRVRYEALSNHLDERGRRLHAASEVLSGGYGAMSAVSRATGLSRTTIRMGLEELGREPLPPGQRRRAGGGRRKVDVLDATLLADLERIIQPHVVGDPEQPLQWVSKSHRKLAVELRAIGHSVSPNTVRRLLGDLGYSRQTNRKTLAGGEHPDRDAQFQHINARVLALQSDNQPVISVDTKKKELVGPYRNAGTDYRPKGDPHKVKVHDFPDKALGKAVPYGVYDIADDSGWVSVGIDRDTAEFAVNAIRRWLEVKGRDRYPDATRVMITADGGGSNGVRVKLWKVELQKLADETGLAFDVCHYPPGTSKWNRIEHRLFCHISQNWRGKPLVSRRAVVELIAATTTTTGLTVDCELDERTYETGIKVSDEEMAAINIERHDFHPEWNYTISPRVHD